ncbi:MAG: hypothetical protein HQK76_06675 [Desulfobacterales bacterium]|nr:hypothetical protein [Desulfobacterales bacterium]
MKNFSPPQILSVGEILFDVYPNYKRLGGAPFNFYFHVNRLGVDSVFISRIGNDVNGKEINNFFDKKGLERKYLQIDDTYPTGYVNIELNEKGIPTFHIVENVAYDYVDFDNKIKLLFSDNLKLIYYGTLIQRTQKGYYSLKTILEYKSPNTKCLYDVNLRPSCYNEDSIKFSLKFCDILKINEDELNIISEIFCLSRTDITKFLIQEFGIEIICITRGEKGSSIITENDMYNIGLNTETEIIDTVGAGDAYASILAFGYLNGWPYDTLITKASEFASKICGIKGAIPIDNSFYNNYLI